jgi:hypothetical protein
MKIEFGGRGSGKTTRAMLAAPHGAVFIWCSPHLDYPTQLAKHLKRDDLKIVSPEWMIDRRWAGLELTGIVRDPDTKVTEDLWDAYKQAAARVRPIAE